MYSNVSSLLYDSYGLRSYRVSSVFCVVILLLKEWLCRLICVAWSIGVWSRALCRFCSVSSARRSIRRPILATCVTDSAACVSRALL